MLSRAVRSFGAVSYHFAHVNARYLFWARCYASSNASTIQAIRDGFTEVRTALTLVNQGERLSTAQREVAQLTKELDVRDFQPYLFVNLTYDRIQIYGRKITRLHHESNSSSRTSQSRPTP